MACEDLDINSIAELLGCLKKVSDILPYVQFGADGCAAVPSDTRCLSPAPIEPTLMQAALSAAAMAATTTAVDVDFSGVEALLQNILDELVATPQIETNGFELLCRDGDPTGYYLVYNYLDEESGNSEIRWYTNGGGTGTGNPPDAVQCTDVKVLDTCFVVKGDPDQYWTRIVCIREGTVIDTLWLSAAGGVQDAAPLAAVPCDGQGIHLVSEIGCYSPGVSDPVEVVIVYGYTEQNEVAFTQYLDSQGVNLGITVAPNVTVGQCRASILTCPTC